MLESTRLLEEMSFCTLPAMEEEHYDGWVLRWAEHGPRRTNSVNPITPSTVPIDDKIRYCEEWFEAHGSSPIFRLTPLADASLEQALDDRGYVRASPTDVMTAPIRQAAASAAVVVTAQPSTAWLRATEGRSAAAPEVIDRLADQLMAGSGRRHFASIGQPGEPLAIGMGIDFDGYTTIYHMHTQPKARRRGHARAILETLLSAGAAAGSTRAFLQVTQANEGAQRLYRSAGFSPVYSYSYRQRRAD